MKISGDLQIKLALAGVVLVGILYLKKQLTKAGGLIDQAEEAAQAINPFNNDNVINRNVQSVYRDLTGSDGTMGTDLYDFTHPTSQASNPYANPVGGAAESLYEKLTGSKGTMGGDLYDWLHK